MNQEYSIRKLGLSDLDEYIRLRREGVRLDPIGFGKAAATEDKVPRWLYAAFLSPSRRRVVWGAFRRDVLVGTVRLQAEGRGARKTIYCLYVHPDERGHGLARRLMSRAIHQAKKNSTVAHVNLNVITKNEHALALYRSAGFRRCGLEENTFQVEGEFYSEYRMRKVIFNRSGPGTRFGRR